MKESMWRGRTAPGGVQKKTGVKDDGKHIITRPAGKKERKEGTRE